MALTFRGGVIFSEGKNTRKIPIENFPAPGLVRIPMLQHIGAPAEPVVQAGDIVDKGQLIGQINADTLSCPVHSSVSGKVTEIENGWAERIIKIENDYADRLCADIRPFDKKINETGAGEIINIIRQAGISGLGGAGFPTYAKIQSAMGKVGALIINGAESEPYITANHRLMLEQPELIINGAKILLKALGLKKCVIVIEDNKLNAADSITRVLKKSKLIEIKILKTKYPQGDERQLIYALTGKETAPDKAPVDRGYIIFNVETVAAICRAFTEGAPLIDRIITVDGDCIMSPKNLRVPIGTPVFELIAYCGLKQEPDIIIQGGGMTGIPVLDKDAPVIKGTTAVLVFSGGKLSERRKRSDFICIRCGRCAESCPMRLQPLYFAMFARNGNIRDCEDYDVMSCTECGCCQYICPAGVPVVEHIRTVKRRINERADFEHEHEHE